ncbi:MAG: tetratricopeptide repeat protein [Candidatus Muiribacteriaceae bacterium]
MKKIILFSIIIFTSFSVFAQFDIPEWVYSYLEDYMDHGFIRQHEDFNMLKVSSRVLIAREVSELLRAYSDDPSIFSTVETTRLGRLCSEFSEEIRFLWGPELNSLTTSLKLLRRQIASNKNIVRSSEFHILGKNGEVKSQETIVHNNVIRAESHLKQGIKLYNKNLYDKALREFRTALSKFPAYVSAQFWMGRVYVKKGEYRMAIDSWQKVVNQLGKRIYLSDFIEDPAHYNEVFMEILEVLSAYPEDPTINRFLKTLQDNLRK